MSRDIVLKDLNSGKHYSITLPCVLGRGQDADLSFPDVTISHRHARIAETDESRIVIEDLQSANGVFVSNVRIRDKTLLKPGDSILLGKTELLLTESEKHIPEQTVILHSLGRVEEERLDHERLKGIYEITSELATSHDVGSLGDKIFTKFKELFKHDRGYIASFEEDSSLKPLCLCSIDETLPLSTTIIKRLLRSGESFILEDALSDMALKEQESILALNVRSAMCVPLIYNNQIYGLIYLDRNVPGAYQQEDLQFLRSIGFILAPLIENARLWSELSNRYADTVTTLKKTEARLIETERTAAYVRLAHAMAHEIRNPVMVIGGRLRRLLKEAVEEKQTNKLRDIMTSVERVESVLREVDSFVKIPRPRKSLNRIDSIVQEVIEGHTEVWQEKSIHPSFTVHSPHLMISLDPDLFKKAVRMVLREIFFTLAKGSTLNISLQDNGSDIEIVFGEVDDRKRMCEPYDPAVKDRPWSLGLFLTIAQTILTDHGGSVLLDPLAHVAFPVIMRLSRTEKHYYQEDKKS